MKVTGFLIGGWAAIPHQSATMDKTMSFFRFVERKTLAAEANASLGQEEIEMDELFKELDRN